MFLALRGYPSKAEAGSIPGKKPSRPPSWQATFQILSPIEAAPHGLVDEALFLHDARVVDVTPVKDDRRV